MPSNTARGGSRRASDRRDSSIEMSALDGRLSIGCQEREHFFWFEVKPTYIEAHIFKDQQIALERDVFALVEGVNDKWMLAVGFGKAGLSDARSSAEEHAPPDQGQRARDKLIELTAWDE